jgi:hypothetical protein
MAVLWIWQIEVWRYPTHLELVILQNYNIACSFVRVWNVVSDIKGKT